MDNTEIKINLYRINNKILKLIFYIIISIYLFIQFILLSNFLFKYFKSKNYGYLLEKICQTKNTEFESERFQLYNNIDKFKIEHKYSKKINYTLILSLILIYGIIYGMILSYIIFDFYYTIIKTEYNDIKKMFYYVLLSLSSIISIGYLPYYIGIKFDNIKNKILLEADDYLLNIFAILSGILIIVNYYNKLIINYSNILLITLIISFYLILYYIKKFINMYKNNIGNDNINNELKKTDNLVIEYIKEIFGLKYYNYEKIEKNDDNNINYYIFLAQIFIIILIILFLINNIKNIFNFFKNYNLEQLLNCLFYRNNSICDYILYNASDSRLLYNIFSRPIIIIILLVIIIYSISVYNKYFNNLIIKEPKIIYNQNIKLINNEFNKLLHNDKIDYNTTTSIEKNVANAIQLVLYNEIFGKVLQYDKDSGEYIEDYNEYIKHINFVPDFKYDFDKKDKIIKYSELEEYNIKKYLNNNNNNIFYENKISKEKCDQMNINKHFLKKFIENIYFNDQINTDEKCSREELRKKKLKYKIYKSIKNIKNGYNYIGTSKFDNTKIEINNKIDINIDYSVISDKTIEEIDDLLDEFDFRYEIDRILNIYYDEYINILKTHLYKIINQSSTVINIHENPEEGCDTIYEYKITKLIINNFIQNPGNNDRINNITNFIESKLCSTFNSINTELETFDTKSNNKDKLEKYIINNYNILNKQNLNDNSIKNSSNSQSALPESNDVFNNYTKKCFTDILVNILINHKIIKFVYSYYSLSDIDSILNRIRETYDESINEKYIEYLKYLYINLSNTYYNYKYNDEYKLNKKDITNILIEIDYNIIKMDINTIINKYNNNIDLVNIYFEENKIYRENSFSAPPAANEHTSITQTLFDDFETNTDYFKQHLDNKIKYISGITQISNEDIASEQIIIKDKLVNYYKMFQTLQYDILESLHYSNFNEINLSRILDNYKYFDKFEAVFEEFINDKDFVKLESETTSTSTIDISTPQNSKNQSIKKLNADINTINILTIYIIVMYIIIIFSIKYI
jgi:hypothetical protein